MAATPDNEKQQKPADDRDQIVVRHPDGKTQNVPAPEYDEPPVRIGRELDNDIILTDPRSSRHHAEIRRGADGQLEVKDLDSANGVLIGVTRIKASVWEKVGAGQMVQMGETRLFWEKSAAAQSTIAMKPAQRPPTTVSPTPAPVVAAAPAAGQKRSLLPILLGLGAIVVLLLIIVIALFFLFNQGDQTETPQIAGATAEATSESGATPEPRSEDLEQQTVGSVPTETPTPEGPRFPIPELEIVSSEVRPIILGALPSTDKALYLINLRVENVGNAPFSVSTGDFSLRTQDGDVLTEAGGTTSEEGLRRLGVKDRFNDLNLTPGGSVAESLIFEVEPENYNFELVFDSPDVEDPVTLNLGPVNAGRELAVALGTPVAEEEETPAALVSAGEEETTPTPEPTPTATRPAAIPAPQVVPRSALVGTIAYPVFNGNDYDLYLGSVADGATQFYRGSASQPFFNTDGSRITFHSWAGDSRGLVAMDVTGANGHLLTNFVEDQLPVFTADSEEVIFLTRRSGGRQSELMKTDAATELGEATVLGEGEYPSVGLNGQLAFKGWGNTAFGLRVASESMGSIQTVTSSDEDTAPALSPDGQRVVFMARRDENWDIYLVNVDGSGLQRLTDDPADDGLPTWSPDGNAIAFVSNRGGPWAVWAITPEGDGLRQLFTMEGSPDGQVGTDTYASRGWAEERISWTSANLVN